VRSNPPRCTLVTRPTRSELALLIVSASLALGPPLRAQSDVAWGFTNFVGQPGGRGNADGTGSAARFDFPLRAAVDSAGNVFVADRDNHAIRQVTTAGVVTTFAGSPGVRGSADGTGNAARFYRPSGLAFDSAGNLHVADSGNDTLRKVTPAGVVSTLAGYPGVWGSADGTGSAARFYSPLDLAADSAGNLYVTDTYNHTLRKVTPAGVVTTLAGSPGSYGSANGTGSTARFYYPGGVTVDSAGNIHVADTQNHALRRVTPAGVVTTRAGSAGTIHRGGRRHRIGHRVRRPSQTGRPDAGLRSAPPGPRPPAGGRSAPGGGDLRGGGPVRFPSG